jgi:hypothetical protein
MATADLYADDLVRRAAYEAGREARRLGLSLRANPHPQGSPERGAWVWGFFAAGRDMREERAS